MEFRHEWKHEISYHGLDKLSLNNIIQDNTYMKDYLTYQMMGYFGVDAPLCSYVYITVNGEDWGLYLAVEGLEESFLERNYGSDYGELYKPDSMSMGGGRGNGGEFDLEDWMDDQSGEESQNTFPDRQAMKGQRPEGMTPPDTVEEVQSNTETMPQDMPGAVPSQDGASDSQTTDPAQTDKQFGGRGGGMGGPMEREDISAQPQGEEVPSGGQPFDLPVGEDSASLPMDGNVPERPQANTAAESGQDPMKLEVGGENQSALNREYGVLLAASAAVLLAGLILAWRYRKRA